MTMPRHRSRSMRRVFVTTPGGENKIQYRKRKPSKAICSSCGAALKGVPRETPSKLKKIPHTSRRPDRPFGGQLCSKCSRQKILSEARADV